MCELSLMKPEDEPEREIVPDDYEPSHSQNEQAEIQRADVSPLVTVFSEQLMACLEECSQGRIGLFGDSSHLSPEEQWPEAAQLRELAFALQSILAQQEERSALCDEFLDLCTIHGENDPGEPRLARNFMRRIDRGEVGTATEPPPPWARKSDANNEDTLT
jgi:hypothetical protein